MKKKLLCCTAIFEAIEAKRLISLAEKMSRAAAVAAANKLSEQDFRVLQKKLVLPPLHYLQSPQNMLSKAPFPFNLAFLVSRRFNAFTEN